MRAPVLVGYAARRKYIFVKGGHLQNLGGRAAHVRPPRPHLRRARPEVTPLLVDQQALGVVRDGRHLDAERLGPVEDADDGAERIAGGRDGQARPVLDARDRPLAFF